MQAMVRQSALSKIATSGIFNNSALNPQVIFYIVVWTCVWYYKFVVCLKLSQSDDQVYVVMSDFLQKLINMQDAILRSMYDDDLSVVQAALSIEGLAAALACPDSLLKAYDDVLTKCIKIINKGE